MKSNTDNQQLNELLTALKNAKPHLQNILTNKRAGGLLPENAISKLLLALNTFEQGDNN